jgi:preprotein translocase subunit SecA
MSVFTKVLKAGEGKKVRRLAELVPPISELEPEMQALSDAELAHKTVEFRERLEQGESLDDLLIEAYAVVREGGYSGSATSTCSSWAAWRCTSGGSPK